MKHAFPYLKKLTVFAVILTLVLAPMSPLMQKVQAKSCAPANPAAGAGATVPDDQPCPQGTYEDTGSSATAGAADCGNFNGGVGVGIGNCVAGFIYIFTVGIGSAVAFVGASFFNLAVHISLDAGAYSLDFVSAGWTTARDIANMAFIFILIYLALTIMFQANTSGTMHTLATVIIIALVINFSFFFTRLVIDAGNILAVQFYNAITTSGNATPFQVGGSGSAVQIPDLTAGIMQGVDLQKALNSDSFKAFQASNNTAGGWIPYTIALAFLYISLGAMFFMLAAAFFMAGAKFLTRIVMLWFMIISAPLALVARASGMRQIEHYYHDWQGNLIRNAFYPVAFLFIFWILSRFMNDLGTGGAIAKLFQDLATPVAGNDVLKEYVSKMAIFIANLGIRIGFVIAMMYIALEASKRFGVYGAQAAEKFGNTMSLGGLAGYTRGLSRASGAIASNTVGRVAYSASANLKASATSGSLWNSADRLARKTVFEPLSKTSFGGAKSYDDLKKASDARKKEIKNDERDAESHNLVHDVAHNGSASPQQIARLQKLSKRELEHLGDDDAAAIASFLTEDQMKIIKNADAFTEKGKDAAEENWHENSGGAPLGKSEKLVEELQETNKKLGDIKYKIGNQTFTLSDAIKSGQQINKKSIGNIREAFSQKMEEAKAQRDEGQAKLSAAIMSNNTTAQDDAKTLIAGAHTIERNTTEALKKVEKLSDEVGKIPANPKATPPRPDKSEFTKK